MAPQKHLEFLKINHSSRSKEAITVKDCKVERKNTGRSGHVTFHKRPSKDATEKETNSTSIGLPNSFPSQGILSKIKNQVLLNPRSKLRLSHDILREKEKVKQFEEDVIITLTAKNPQSSKNLIRFHGIRKEFVTIKLVESMIDHLVIESTILHRNSAEAKKQLEIEAGNPKQKRSIVSCKSEETKLNGKESEASIAKTSKITNRWKEVRSSLIEVATNASDDYEEDNKLEEEKPSEYNSIRRSSVLSLDDLNDEEGEKRLKNEFAITTRATQTKNFSLRNTSQQTDPPLKAIFSQTVNQWVIYDAYERHEIAKEAQEEKERKKSRATYEYEAGSKDWNIRNKNEAETKENAYQNKLSIKFMGAAKILERMVNQVIYDQVIKDFKYYQDPSDDFRETEGTLLPLWKFSFINARHLDVTGLCWNPKYNDLFAVSYGSYSFQEHTKQMQRKSKGLICVYSLKNPTYPEFICYSSCAILCIDINPNHSHMIAAGLIDGNVAVYNLQIKSQHPFYISDARNGKHQNVVNQIQWAKDDIDGYLNFYAVSEDGTVSHWTLVKSSLCYSKILSISFAKHLKNHVSSTKDILKDGGKCISFNPKDESIFLIGTDGGNVYQCTTDYSSIFINTYVAHNMPVYNVCWNHYVPSIFLTCAADWLIKIWDEKSTSPLFMFDLNCEVGDVAWSPFSSTVFAAVTLDGRAHIFDLKIEKYRPICSQHIVSSKRASLNHVSFNNIHPILIVGDSRGYTHCLKLSPNLRRPTKEYKAALISEDDKSAWSCEVRQLKSILDMVRDKDFKDDENFVKQEEEELI